jgi:peptidoglycan/LPS O-acetylase OafA/YrhL
MVLGYHVALAGGTTRTGTLAPLLAQLKGGVAVFFVISGTLLYLPYARAIRSSTPLRDWRRYARRRAVRILPAYWVVLTAVAIGPFGGSVLTPNAWRFYGLTQIYDPSTLSGGLGVAWSLCVEVSFYALLPLIAVAVARLAALRRWGCSSRPQLLLIAVIGGATVILRLAAAGSAIAPVSGAYTELASSLPGLIDWFVLGMAIAVLAAEWEAGGGYAPALAWLARRSGLCWLLAGGCWVAGVAAAPDDLFLPAYGLATHLAIGVAAALFVLPAVYPTAAPKRPLSLLTLPVLAWLGTISYGIYLWHVPVLYALRGTSIPASSQLGLPALALLFVEVAAGAVVLGALSWYLVERPAQHLFGRRDRAQARPALSVGTVVGGSESAVTASPVVAS